MHSVYLYAKRSPEAINFARKVKDIVNREGFRAVSDQEELDFVDRVEPGR